jgi:hypothetical protein
LGSPLLDETRAILIRCMTLYMPGPRNIANTSNPCDEPKGTETCTNRSPAQRSAEHVTFNHGVEGSSPSALTMKPPFCKGLLKLYPVTVPTKWGLGTVRVQKSFSYCSFALPTPISLWGVDFPNQPNPRGLADGNALWNLPFASSWSNRPPIHYSNSTLLTNRPHYRRVCASCCIPSAHACTDERI